MTERYRSRQPRAAALILVGIGVLLGFVQHAVGSAVKPAAQAPQAVDRRSVWDGVYTAQQAARGQMQYEYSCGRCHQQELQGDSSRDIPPLNDDGFLKYWNGRSVKELFDLTTKTMPADSPASLRASSYLDVLAYIFQMNQFPSGGDELDSERLDRIVIEKKP
jgi:mono/diheme cytochrome c family protein